MKDFESFLEEFDRDQESLEESSLSRLVRKGDKGGSAFMSAERGDKSNKENAARSKQLAKDIRGKGLPGPTKVEGQYKEAGSDAPTKEKSYGISSGKMGKRKFKKAVKSLGKKYDQDSVLIQKNKKSDAKLHPTTKAGKADLKGWDGKVGKMKPGGTGDMQTRIKGKTFTMEEVELFEDLKRDLQVRASEGDRAAMEKLKKLRAAGKIGKESGFEPGAKKDIPDMEKIEGIKENYGDNTNDPKKLEKELPKGYKYGTPRQGKGDHKTAALEVDGTETDMKIGGAAKGKAGSFSPSWKGEHNKVKKTLKGIDKAVSEVQKSTKGSNDTLKRMSKAYASKVKTDASKAISDMTGVGRKTNTQGKGNKALKRAGLREFAESLGMDTEVHPVDADRRGVDAGIAAGYDAVDAHQGIAGTTQLDSPDSLGKLAATMGRVQRDGGQNSPVPDKKGPKSLYALDREQQSAQQPTETE